VQFCYQPIKQVIELAMNDSKDKLFALLGKINVLHKLKSEEKDLVGKPLMKRIMQVRKDCCTSCARRNNRQCSPAAGGGGGGKGALALCSRRRERETGKNRALAKESCTQKTRKDRC